jgi:HK97 family phage major capsid protein
MSKFTKAQLEAMLKDVETTEEVVTPEAEVEPVVETEDVAVEVEKAFSKKATEVKSELKADLKEAVSGMKSEIEAYLKSQKEAMATKSGSFADEVQVKHAKINSYLKDFSRALIDGNDVKAKEMTTDKTGSPFAGYVVDSELSAEIRHLVTEYGVARREFFSTALSKNSYEANALATDVTVAWVSETGVIGSTQVVLAQEELKLKKLGAIVSLTRELIDDQEVDLFSFIATRVAEGFAKAEDKAFFVGEGNGDTANGEYTGICNNASIPDVTLDATKDAVSDITVEDIYEMIDTLPEGAQAGAKFYMNRTVRSAIRLLKDGDGRYIYQDPINNSGLATLAGKPVVTVEVMPTSTTAEAGDTVLVYGDLKKTTILGYKSGIVADRFNAGVIRNVAGNGDTNLITTDREAIRWISRVGFITILPTASVRLVLGSAS